ncbi:hypothetical protein [Burkholderia gladioli]|uniref:hypothetical protein n=1 Tax=Burkholderia gladioli TaxID=28095 RepID=UPI0022D6711B|nr:hypothetical protein [Burkholderia gladioli]MDA0574508.1 hypothetical protein [Burkholderia gladioli]MDA0602622.1 hypothetical protein [Burkholderia gladioli]
MFSALRLQKGLAIRRTDATSTRYDQTSQKEGFMYFSAIKKGIGSVEEKIFYNVALLFLSAKGYKDLEIIDGKGDGGRDVKCSRSNIRIQLSVMANWRAKLNKEAKTTKDAGVTHFLYVTNRLITEGIRNSFFDNEYKLQGEVEITILDLNAISTTLSLPRYRQEACKILGMFIDKTIKASQSDVAISNLLLFSDESRELRDNIIESHIGAVLHFKGSLPEGDLINEVRSSLRVGNSIGNIKKAVGRMRSHGKLVNVAKGLDLSDATRATIRAAHDDYVLSIKHDRDNLEKKYQLTTDAADAFIKIALELLSKGQERDSGTELSEALNALISDHKLTDRKTELYGDLARLNVARVKQYGKTVDHIQNTNTFDIYRALGMQTSLQMILDASVAMPMLFGLAFKAAHSRYGVAAEALESMCREHEIKLTVPDFYINEMAHHGLSAFGYLDEYEKIPARSKDYLIGSENAYLSHYSYIRDFANDDDGKSLTLRDFLALFGIYADSSPRQIENKIGSLLNSYGIQIISGHGYDGKVISDLRELKPNESDIIIKHDASLVRLISENQDSGYIFATWDRTLILYLEGISRVLADTPARINDFLSMANGTAYESDESVELLTSLIYCDEQKLVALAKKIEKVMRAKHGYLLTQYSDEERAKHGKHWQLSGDALDFFIASMEEEQ